VEVCGIGPSYEDFVAGFAPTSDPGWSVDPQDGCLDVNGGDNDVLNVRYVCALCGAVCAVGVFARSDVCVCMRRVVWGCAILYVLLARVHDPSSCD